MNRQGWIRLGILWPWWILFLWAAACGLIAAWGTPALARGAAETVLASGEVVAVTETAVTVQMETGAKQFSLSGALVFLNGEEVSPGALAPITPEDLVEVKVVRVGTQLRVEGWYQVREVLVLGWDLAHGSITVVPVEGDGERPASETYRLAGAQVENLFRKGVIELGQDVLLVLDSGGRVKNIAAGTW